jgi:hypothetical protein
MQQGSLQLLIFDTMRNFSWVKWVLCLSLAACQANESISPPPLGNQVCGELDSLFQTLTEMDSVLANEAPWEVCKPYLLASLAPLSHNQRKDNKDCNYLDQKYRADEPRLLWVETLRNRIEQDTIPEGIYYLLRWRGVFKGDPEISEFFSEELSYVAMGNPACYWGYLKQNPDQEVMLLYSTKWNALDLDTLVGRFGRLPDADPVVNFLRNLKDQKSDGI